MPGLVAPLVDERELLLAFLASSATPCATPPMASTDEQVAGRPTVSELCLAGLIKHAALVERAWTTYLTTGDTCVFAPGDEDDWADGFRLTEGETLDDVLALADDQARLTEKVVGALEDLGAPLRRPPTSSRGSPVASSGRRAGSCCTSSRRRPATPGTPTSSASPSTVPPAGR